MHPCGPDVLTSNAEWSPFVRRRGFTRHSAKMNEQKLTSLHPPFVHPAERALADLFDRHGIRWRYEPHVFELDRDADGRTTKAFRPDFYLPDLDMYVECTMMKQSLTPRKSRKARAAAAKHGIVVVLFYRRDLERLSEQHGLRLDEAA